MSATYYTIQSRTSKDGTMCQYSIDGNFIGVSIRNKEARFKTQLGAENQARKLVDSPMIDGFCHVIKNTEENGLIDERKVSTLKKGDLAHGLLKSIKKEF